MEGPETYTVMLGDTRLDLPVVPLRGTSIRIALADTLGDWRLCDMLAARLLDKARAGGMNLSRIEAVLTAGKAVTLGEAIARVLDIGAMAVADKKWKNFWPDAYAVTSSSITSGQKEQLVLGGRRAQLLQGKGILVVDDVISTGSSIRALCALARHYGDLRGVMVPFIEGSPDDLPTEVDGTPAVTLAGLPIWKDA